MVELLKQGQYQPVPVEKQVIVIWAGGNGYLDDIPVEDVRRFEAELLEEFRVRHTDLLTEIRDKGTLPDEATLTAAPQCRPRCSPRLGSGSEPCSSTSPRTTTSRQCWPTSGRSRTCTSRTDPAVQRGERRATGNDRRATARTC